MNQAKNVPVQVFRPLHLRPSISPLVTQYFSGTCIKTRRVMQIGSSHVITSGSILLAHKSCAHFNPLGLYPSSLPLCNPTLETLLIRLFVKSFFDESYLIHLSKRESLHKNRLLCSIQAMYHFLFLRYTMTTLTRSEAPT